RFNSTGETLNEKLSGPSSTDGKSTAGSVLKVNLLLPDLTCIFCSDNEKCKSLPSGNDLQISTSFRAGRVIDPAAPEDSRVTLPISSTSKSVPVSDKRFPSTQSNTLDK